MYLGWNYLSIPKLQRCNRWSLRMDKKFHLTLCWACNYLSMLGLKLTHVSERGYYHHKDKTVSLPSCFLPETSFGLCVLSNNIVSCVCLFVCLCVNHKLVFMRTLDKRCETLVKIPVVLGVDWYWLSRSDLTYKSRFIVPSFSFSVNTQPPE